MAESFACKAGWIHFSNDSVKSLYEVWISEAVRLRSISGMTAVREFLQKALDQEGPGCRGFGLYGEYLPEEIADAESLAALGELIRSTLERPQTLTDIAWTDELIRSWKARLQAMLDSVSTVSAEA